MSFLQPVRWLGLEEKELGAGSTSRCTSPPSIPSVLPDGCLRIAPHRTSARLLTTLQERRWVRKCSLSGSAPLSSPAAPRGEGAGFVNRNRPKCLSNSFYKC